MSSGPSCPIEYRYRATDFRGAPSLEADTVYVIGGLYGNTEALRTILAMQAGEARQGTRVSLVFNGDHNWFDVDPVSFEAINSAALEGVAIRGNVEAEIASPTDGCGCNYPDYVNAEYVARSNAIMSRLQLTARDFPKIREALSALPMFRTIQIGDARIGVVHGDAESLAGWSFAAERLSPLRKSCSGDAPTTQLTPIDAIERIFREANVHAFASTHTCLAHARDFMVDGEPRLIINNGAAGLPNFAATRFGILTRISVDPTVPGESLYGVAQNGVRFDALPVRYDHEAWLRTFLRNWPPGSPAHIAYFDRIMNGPDFEPGDAVGGDIALT